MLIGRQLTDSQLDAVSIAGNNNQQKKTIKLGMQGDLNIDGQQDGQIFISLDEDKLG